MFEIVYILLEKDQITARQLAEHFEVSERTIYRDIEKLSMSGIPIYTNKGKGGGIRLIENFTLNKSMLSEWEQREILSSLQGLNAVSPDQSDQTLQKLSGFFKKELTNWIQVDFSDWSGRAKDRFGILKDAILKKREIVFTYYSSYGQKTERRVEPVQLWFKHGAWYLKAFCLEKEKLRVFKLYRINDLEVTEAEFVDRGLEAELDFEQATMPVPPRQYMEFKLHIDAKAGYRVYDEFGEEQIEKQPDGSFITMMRCPEDDWLYGYLMSFGSHLTVLGPEHVKTNLKKMLSEMLKHYL